MKNFFKTTTMLVAGVLILGLLACNEDDDTLPDLEIPTTYDSDDYATNVVAENIVIDELATMTAAANEAESNAQASKVGPITYPSTLSSVTILSYSTLVEDWLVELVKSANDDDRFQNPGIGTPALGEEGGLLGTRLLDENGLELEQMIQKGSFGAALYNHALTVIGGDLSSSAAIDKLVEIHGTEPTFDPTKTTAAATYSRRRSNQTTETGTFYDIRNSLLKAKAAIEAGSEFDDIRDQALSDYLLAWEKSNFATVIYYCYATKILLQTAGDDETMLGDAMHAYAEGVAFAHGFKGLSNKKITDEQIDDVLELLLAPDGEVPESYMFLNDAALITNLDQIVEDLQDIYGFTDEEVNSFYVNDPT